MGHRWIDQSTCTSLLKSKIPSSNGPIQKLDLCIRHICRSGKNNRVADASCCNGQGTYVPIFGSQTNWFLEGSELSAVPVGAETDIQKLQCQDSQLVEVIRFAHEGHLPENEGLAQKHMLERYLFEVMDGVLFYVSP